MIVTRNVRPPIPTRSFDWEAHYDGHEITGPIGWGRTEMEAIADLISNLATEDEMADRVLVTGIEGGPGTGVILEDGDPNYTTIAMDNDRGTIAVRTGHPTIRFCRLAELGSEDNSNRS